jgi:hypothetical protein
VPGPTRTTISPYRCEVIQVDVLVPGLLELDLDPPELLVLHLQLDLVDLELVQERG